jgi:hypothetical protein
MANENPLAPLFAPYSPDPTAQTGTIHDVLRDLRLDDDRVLGSVDPRNEGDDTIFKDFQGGPGPNTDSDSKGNASGSDDIIQRDPAPEPRAFRVGEALHFSFDYTRDIAPINVEWIIVDYQTPAKQLTTLADPQMNLGGSSGGKQSCQRWWRKKGKKTTRLLHSFIIVSSPSLEAKKERQRNLTF